MHSAANNYQSRIFEGGTSHKEQDTSMTEILPASLPGRAPILDAHTFRAVNTCLVNARFRHRHDEKSFTQMTPSDN